MESRMSDKLTIALTDRRPVCVDKNEWPLIASADADSWSGSPDPARHHQALQRGELDRWAIRVRRHADGRAIVYGVCVAGWDGAHDWAGGELLPAGCNDADIAESSWVICLDGELPPQLAREIIADLPAEEI